MSETVTMTENSSKTQISEFFFMEMLGFSLDNDCSQETWFLREIGILNQIVDYFVTLHPNEETRTSVLLNHSFRISRWALAHDCPVTTGR